MESSVVVNRSSYVWQPSSWHITNANVSRLIRHLGTADYADLLRRSQEDIAWFWDGVVRDLGIVFSTP